MNEIQTTDTDGTGSLPDSETPARCPHCDRPFPDESYLTLHEGLAHHGQLDAERRQEFTDAYEAEERAIRRYRLKALAVLVLLYFTFLWTYSIVT